VAARSFDALVAARSFDAHARRDKPGR